MDQKYRRVAYYPGCALEGSGHAYNRSTKAVGKALGLDLVEVKNWNCCGAMEVKNIDPKLQTYLSSRVMSIAAHDMGFDTVMAPCNGCYHNLKKAEHDLGKDPGSREVVERLSDKAGHKTYEAGQIETIHALDWIKDAIGEEGIRARVKNSLAGLKIANYYGCMYTRPRHIFPEKDRGARQRIYLGPPFHGRYSGGRRGRDRLFPPQDRLLRRGAYAVRFRHLDQTRPQHPESRRNGRGRRDRHGVPDLSLGPGDAPDPRRKGVRRAHRREDPLFHPVVGPGPRADAAQSRGPGKHLGPHGPAEGRRSLHDTAR